MPKKNYTLLLLKWFIICLLFAIVTHFTILINGNGLKFPIVVLLNVLFTVFIQRRHPDLRYFSVILFFSSLLFYLFGYSVDADFSRLQVSYFSTFGVFVGIIGGYFLTRFPKYWFPQVAILVSINIWVYFVGFDYWLQKVNFGNFTGNDKYVISDTLNFYNIEKTKLDEFAMSQDTVILMDFWTSTCGACFKSFPDLERMHKTYNGKTNLKIVSINVPYSDEDYNKLNNMIISRDFSFPVVFMEDEHAKTLKVHFFPTVLLSKKGVVFFRGSLKQAEKVLEELVDNESVIIKS